MILKPAAPLPPVADPGSSVMLHAPVDQDNIPHGYEYEWSPDAPTELPVGQSVFDKFPGESVDALRQACFMRFDFFVAFVLKYDVTPFHVQMMEWRLTRKSSMTLAGRGFGKSTILTVAWLLWRLIQDGNLRICIASKTGDQAKAFLGQIKAHMTDNPDFIALFGELRGVTWNEDEIIVSTRTKILKEPTITALGAGAGIPGRHFDIIEADDIVDDENCLTPHQRDRMERWYKLTLRPTLEPYGEIHLVGTRWHPDDLYGRFAKQKNGVYANKRFGPNVLVIPAIVKDPDTGVETSSLPNMFSMEFLVSEREDMGMLLFNLAYQNDASIAEGGIFSIDNLEPYVWQFEGAPKTVYGGTGRCRPPMNELIIYQGIDPAISEKTGADFFAHCTIGISVLDYHIYVLELIKRKLGPDEQVDLILAQWEKWSPHKIGIETNAYQKALAKLVMGRTPYVPVHEIHTQRDKTQRAMVLSAYTERHEIHVHHLMTDLMETLVQMPNPESGHDDDFDALDFAVETAKKNVLSGSVVARVPVRKLRRR